MSEKKDSTPQLPAEIAGVCAALGVNADELLEKLVDRLADRCLGEELDEWDEESGAAYRKSDLGSYLRGRVKAAIDSAVDKLAEATLVPMVEELVNGTVLRETNKYGEFKADAIPFKEYIANRAEKWLQETVDWKGNPREADTYNWRGKQPRIVHMIHEHLEHHIRIALQETLGEADKTIKAGIVETVKAKLAEVKLQLAVTTERKS